MCERWTSDVLDASYWKCVLQCAEACSSVKLCYAGWTLHQLILPTLGCAEELPKQGSNRNVQDLAPL